MTAQEANPPTLLDIVLALEDKVGTWAEHEQIVVWTSSDGKVKAFLDVGINHVDLRLSNWGKPLTVWYKTPFKGEWRRAVQLEENYNSWSSFYQTLKREGFITEKGDTRLYDWEQAALRREQRKRARQQKKK